jgi:hypothetical protein
MKTRHWSFVSLAAAYAFLSSAPALVGCSSGGSSGTAGTSGGGSGGSGGGGGGSTVVLDPMNLISDFEDPAAATVVMAGTPTRNGYWYTYNDQTPCTQVPPAMDMTVKYIGTAPPAGVPNAGMGSLSLHGSWSGCTIWGAGIGADLNQPMVPDGGTYTGKKVVYDVGPYTGVTFWAQAATGSDTALRIKFPMSDETKVEDGGDCMDSTTNKCSDDWGEQFNLPGNGSWKQFTIKWADTGFHQEGWGAVFAWNPAHVTSIQIQSVDKGEMYDFWLDDLYFIK